MPGTTSICSRGHSYHVYCRNKMIYGQFSEMLRKLGNQLKTKRERDASLVKEQAIDESQEARRLKAKNLP